ncbi:MAG: DNA mismatch repair endonuclease MutL [Thermoplasmata archaeon]
MDGIKILSPQTVNQIAAGEVIERPASVVKELIENSMDAGADDIKIEVKDGGRDLIKVIDNGSGMGRDEVELAFEKHATSKIDDIQDLDDLRTLGFRGEALPSIAAVSKVRVVTKREEDVEATEMIIHGGEKKELGSIGAPVGTTVEVRELFYNTPARRKYLKKKSTELAHVSEVVTRYALAHPEISFQLVHDGNELISTPKSKSLLENIRDIYGKELAKNMVHVSHENEIFRLEGYLSKPDFTRSTRSHIYTYVNGRYVNNKLLKDSVVKGYGTLLFKHRYPICVLKLELDGSLIDVNVHPTKTKIRFREERKLQEELIAAIRGSFHDQDLIPDRKTDGKEGEKEEKGESEEKNQKDLSLGQSHLEVGREERVDKTSLPEMRIVGIVNDLYIVAETAEGMMVIDQHAAHERINYERIKSIYGDERGAQSLVSPFTVELKPRQAAVLRANGDLIENLGFKVEEFGKTTFRIRSVPVVMGEMQDVDIIHDILDEIMEMKNNSLEERKEEVIRYMACHSSITSGDVISVTNAKKLVQELGGCDNPYTCPHGRPTVISFDEKEMKKWFKRT